MLWFHAESARNVRDRRQRRIHLSGFDFLPVTPMDMGSRCGPLDGQVHRASEIAHILLESTQKSFVGFMCSFLDYARRSASCGCQGS
jgi:hypothetical protein